MSKKSLVPCKSVLITFHGDTTHATQLTGYDHATRTKSAWAKRNPDDDYNAYEGARIALARLFGVDPFPEMEKPDTPEKSDDSEMGKPLKYKVGARVRVVNPCGAFGYGIGHTGTVVSIPNGAAGGAHIQFDHIKGVTRFCYRTEFELIDDTAAEKPKAAAPEKPDAPEKKPLEYKPGARVRVIRAREANKYRNGDVGTVVQIPYGPEGGAYVQFDHLRGAEAYRAGIRFCYRNEFELTGDFVEKNKKPEPAKSKPKVIKDFKVEVTVTPVYEEEP